eukprot:5460533-Prymnesium_polylepis.1
MRVVLQHVCDVLCECVRTAWGFVSSAGRVRCGVRLGWAGRRLVCECGPQVRNGGGSLRSFFAGEMAANARRYLCPPSGPGPGVYCIRGVNAPTATRR